MNKYEPIYNLKNLKELANDLVTLEITIESIVGNPIFKEQASLPEDFFKSTDKFSESVKNSVIGALLEF